MTFKNVLKGCVSRYDINRITVIDGHSILFNGFLAKFTYDCDINMKSYRDNLLSKPVEAKTINGDTLFIFLEQPKETPPEDFEPIAHLILNKDY